MPPALVETTEELKTLIGFTAVHFLASWESRTDTRKPLSLILKIHTSSTDNSGGANCHQAYSGGAKCHLA